MLSGQFAPAYTGQFTPACTGQLKPAQGGQLHRRLHAMMSDTQQLNTTKGTVFGAYNAVTGYYQNVRNYKDDESKLQSIVMGGTAQAKAQRAFELCNQFAKDGADVLMLN